MSVWDDNTSRLVDECLGQRHRQTCQQADLPTAAQYVKKSKLKTIFGYTLKIKKLPLVKNFSPI
jgi:hypothetical protein